MALELNGTTGVSEVQAGIVTDDKLALSANSAEVKEALNATGSAPIYACRAWVNFDGTNLTIRDSGNVSSITDNGSGKYIVNFATAMPDANYSWALGAEKSISSFTFAMITTVDAPSSIQNTSLLFLTGQKDQASPSDSTSVSCSIFR